MIQNKRGQTEAGRKATYINECFMVSNACAAAAARTWLQSEERSHWLDWSGRRGRSRCSARRWCITEWCWCGCSTSRRHSAAGTVFSSGWSGFFCGCCGSGTRTKNPACHNKSSPKSHSYKVKKKKKQTITNPIIIATYIHK